MSAWDDVRGLIERRDARRVAAKVRELDVAGRRAVAQELPGYVRSRRAEDRFGQLEPQLARPLLVAGVGTITGAAAAASWVCRAELRRQFFGQNQPEGVADLCVWVTDDRSREWRTQVAERIAERLRPSGGRWRNEQPWRIAAALVRAARSGPPGADAFVLGWLEWGTRPGVLAEDPFLDALLPRIFEVDGVGAQLTWPTEGPHTWEAALAGLAAGGRVARETLLDGCVSRFLRGGTVQDLRWFVRLHDALSPVEEEIARRLRDYVRLLPSSPAPVAEMALRETRRMDDGGGLDEAAFGEAAEALLFRPEKKLVRATLSWLDGTARKRDRVDATLRAMAVAFSSDTLDLRERAVRVITKHASRAAEDTLLVLREAAAELPPELRDAVAAACGPVEAAAPAVVPPPGPPGYLPRELAPPIASVPELAEEFLVQAREECTWPGVERVLAGLVEFAHREPVATREALAGISHASMPWLLDRSAYFHVNDHPATWLGLVGRAVLTRKKGRLANLLSTVRGTVTGTQAQPAPQRLLVDRILEMASVTGRTPLLLATPTMASGHLDPAELVRRLELLESSGAQPGPIELELALLRLPRDPGSAAVAGARRLISPAGKTAAAWLEDGGLPDPEVTCSLVQARWREPAYYRYDTGPFPRLLATITPRRHKGNVRGLCELQAETELSRFHYYGNADWWTTVMPSHPEVIAAHLLRYLADWTEGRHGQGAAMIGLAEAGGPAGPATAAALAYSLGSRHQSERAGAVDALLTFSARRRLPAADLGGAVATLATHKLVKLNRVTDALADAARAGAHADVWASVAAALPGLLPEPGARLPTGLPDLLALATETVEATGARAHIPELAAVAARSGAGRLVRESARLHRRLTAP